MSKAVIFSILTIGLTVALAPTSASAQTCEPLDDGRLAEVFYEGTTIFWEPVLEYRRMVLTIGGPCEDIVKVFEKGEPISFDIREIQKVTDGTYTWELRREAAIDSGVQKDLEASRGTGEEDAVWWNYFQKGAIPAGPYVDSASFTVDRGVIVDPNQVEEKRATVAPRAGAAWAGSSLAAGFTPASSDGATGGNGLATRDQVIPDDLIVQGSACVGFDCVNGESFGFDTIRLKENNLRIQFNDTSVGSFPTENWQIRANSSAGGGQSFLGFVDQGANDTSETGTLVFAVEAGARANALYVESDGDVGLGTSNPVLDFHVNSGDTPSLRLEQNNSSGFAAQTWDIAGNEANFFIRDVTGGSRLPFRIRPGAPTSSLDIAASGNVGVGTASPSAPLHVTRSNGTAQLLVEETNASIAGRVVLLMRNNGPVRFNFENSATGAAWQQQLDGGGNFDLNSGAGGQFQLAQNGDLTISGEIVTGGGTCGGGCDRVFSEDYPLESIEEHAESMWRHSYLPAVGPTPEGEPINLSAKTGGMLNELEKAHIYIEQLHRQSRELAERLAKLEALLAPEKQ